MCLFARIAAPLENTTLGQRTKAWAVFVLCTAALFANAQQAFNLDSLRQVAASAPDWQARMEAQFHLALRIHVRGMDSTLYYAGVLAKESVRRNYPKGRGMAAELYATAHLGKREYEKCFDYYREAVAHYREAGENKRAAVAIENMAYGLLYLHRYGEACQYLFQALEIYKQQRDSSGMATVSVSIGRALASQNRFQEAERFLRSALDMEKKIRAPLYGTYSRMASLFASAGKLDSASHYRRLALETAQQSGDQRGVAREKMDYADLYTQMGDYAKAETLYYEALAYFERFGDKLILPSLYIDLADLENRKGNHRAALGFTEKALQYVKDPSNYRILAPVYRQQAQSYEGLGDLAKALAATKLWKTASDSLVAKANAAQVADISGQYRTREQEATIAEQSLQLEREKSRRNLLLLFGLLLVFGSGVFFQYLRNRERLKKERAEHALKLEQTEAEKLREMDRLKSDFFANVSHELRTPLTLILGPLDTALKNKQLGQRDAGLLALAQQNAQQLLSLVGDILDLTKLDAGKMQVDESAVPLYLWFNRVVAQFDSHAQRFGLQLACSYAAPSQLRVLIDRKKLETVLNNLLANAMKFTPPGGRVDVRLEDRQEHLLLSVTDNGRGIPTADLAKVFDRFYQSHHSEGPGEGGTGIGLAICREYAQLFDGRIWAESPVSRHSDTGMPGTAFFFEFPKKEVFGQTAESNPDLDIPAVQAIPLPVAQQEGHPTLLVVEDNEGLQQYMAAIFSDEFRVKTVPHGAAALEQLASGEPLPDLILSDIMMPIMDGLQFLEHLKSEERYRHIPVVMLTARADMSDKLQALRIGVDDYLLKPFVEEELLARIRNLLANARRRQEPAPVEETPTAPYPTPAEQQTWLADLEQALAKRLGDFDLTAETLADDMAMSRAQFFRQLKKYTGLTPAQYVDEARFRQARLLLETARVRSVKAAAYEVGFRDEKHFARAFKARFGKYPSEYLG